MTRTNAEDNDPTPADSTDHATNTGSKRGKARSRAKSTAASSTKKGAARKATAKKSPKKAAKKGTASKSSANKATTRKAAARPTTKKATAKKATAKKAAAKKAGNPATTKAVASAETAPTTPTTPARSKPQTAAKTTASPPERIEYPTRFRDDGQQADDIGFAVALKKFEVDGPSSRQKSPPQLREVDSAVALADATDDEQYCHDDEELGEIAATAAEALMALDAEADTDDTAEAGDAAASAGRSGLEALVDIANGKPLDDPTDDGIIDVHEQLDIATEAAEALSQLLDEDSEAFEPEHRFVEDIDATPAAPPASAAFEAPMTFAESDPSRTSSTLGQIVGVLLILMGLGMILSRVF